MFSKCSETKLLVLSVQLLFFICTIQPEARIRFIGLAATLAGKEEIP